MRQIIEATIKYKVVSPEMDSPSSFITAETVSDVLHEKVAKGLGWCSFSKEDVLEVTEVKITNVDLEEVSEDA